MIDFGNFDRVFYNQFFTVGTENKLYINNISNIVHGSYKRTYDLMYNNNDVLIENFHKEKLLFINEKHDTVFHFDNCIIRILEADRVVLSFTNQKEHKFDEKYKYFKELNNHIRKLKIEKVLRESFNQ
jgi:hypothetical protein